MVLQYHTSMMKEKMIIMKISFVTLLEVNNSDNFMVKTPTSE